MDEIKKLINLGVKIKIKLWLVRPLPSIKQVEQLKNSIEYWLGYIFITDSIFEYIIKNTLRDNNENKWSICWIL